MNIIKYISAFIIITAAGMLYDRYKKKFGLDIELNNREKIQKFLLNDRTLLNGKPVLWIHNTYEVNSRNWLSFGSRSTKEINQPYLSLCIETLIKNCGDSFNICLIDDNSFETLIPNWSINMNKLADPIKSHMRQLGLLKLLYYYGGLNIPSSTIVMKNLECLYNSLIGKGMFAMEMVNKNKTSNVSEFFPNSKMIGCVQNNESMKKLITFLEEKISFDNTNEMDFEGYVNRYIYKLSTENAITIGNGKLIGVKDCDNGPIGIEDLLNNTPIKFDKNLYCIYLPDKDILSRTKYQWFTRLCKKQVLNGNTIASKKLLISLGKHSI